MNPDENGANLLCADIEQACPTCDMCQVKFQIQNLNLFTFQ